MQQVCQKVSISKSSHSPSYFSECLKYFLKSPEKPLITNACENILLLSIKRGTAINLISTFQIHSTLKQIKEPGVGTVCVW